MPPPSRMGAVIEPGAACSRLTASKRFDLPLPFAPNQHVQRSQWQLDPARAERQQVTELDLVKQHRSFQNVTPRQHLRLVVIGSARLVRPVYRHGKLGVNVLVPG